MNSIEMAIITVTRYGNVLFSRAQSFHFINLIKQNKDLPITDPTMTRFLMTLDESVSLVLMAFENGNHGDTFAESKCH